MERACTTAALDKRNHGLLVAGATSYRGIGQAADLGFVNLDSLAVAAERREVARRHCKANAMVQEPSGLIGAFEYPDDGSLDLSANEQILVDDVVRYWRDFVRTGSSDVMKLDGRQGLPGFAESFTAQINTVYPATPLSRALVFAPRASRASDRKAGCSPWGSAHGCRRGSNGRASEVKYRRPTGAVLIALPLEIGILLEPAMLTQQHVHDDHHLARHAGFARHHPLNCPNGRGEVAIVTVLVHEVRAWREH